MKKSVIFGIFALMLSTVLQAQEVAETELQKINVEPSQLAFANGEIFAHLRGEWVPVDAVYSDASGLLAAIKKNVYHDRWICECFFNNNGWDATCRRPLPNNNYCGKPRPW